MARSNATALLAVAMFACALFPRPSLSRPPSPAELAELVEAQPDIPARDLYYGVGGPELAPRVERVFRYLATDGRGASPGLDVEDADGRRWDVKLGREVQGEVVASRLLWAIGFHQPPVYYVREWHVAGGPDPGPQPPARFRPDWIDWDKQGTWSWSHNPFVGTRELGGLLAMMVLLNNWDLKTSQNVVYERPSGAPRRVYVVRDLGAVLGQTGWFSNTKNDVEDFEREPFILEVRGGRPVFSFRGAWFEPWVHERLTLQDVVWLCERLDRLRDEQWRAAFRAAGYPDAVAARFIARLQEKVQQGLRLAEAAG